MSVLMYGAVYQAAVVSVLMYGAVYQAAVVSCMEQRHGPTIRHLMALHNRCVRISRGVTRFEQWQQRMTSRMLSERSGMSWSLVDMPVMDRKLQWLVI